MKNITYKILTGVLFFMVLLSSCTKLEDKSYTIIQASQFSPTKDDIAAITASAYTQWDALFLQWNGVWRSQEVAADEIVIPARPNGWVDGGIYARIHKHLFSSDEDNVLQAWNRTYSGISSCNRIIYQIQSGFLPLTTTKAAVLAELRVIRASYYYVLCDLFGNVPIDTLYKVETGYIPVQKSRKEVYDFIISEITSSLPYLPRERNGLTYGRFNVWAARTLLAKMYLNAEVFTGTANWQNCIAQCDSVINSNVGYALEDDQKNVFITENQDSKEIIFGIAIDGTYTTAWNTFDIHMQTLEPENQATYKLTQGPWGGMCAVPQFINTFDADDSRLTRNYIMGPQYSFDGTPLICSMGSVKGQPLAYVNEVPSVDASEEIHGYRFGKFEIGIGSSNVLNNDFPLFRYADIIMMKAECLLRTGHADAAAVLVTKIRTRAFKANPSKAVVTGADLQTGSIYDYGKRYIDPVTKTAVETHQGGSDIVNGRFLDELAWEFNQEGRRRQDMIRFGAFTTKDWFSHTSQGSNKALYPIPLSAMNTNSTLKQNPGY
jgi:hypothetical protein